MRLFIAVNLNDEIKDHLTKFISQLKANSIKGNFTRRENLHITLVFLGEVPKENISLVKQAMEEIQSAPFQLSLSGLGSFDRRGDHLYWIGIEGCKSLNDIYQQLREKLTSSGFVLENRPFNPHLTIGRQVVTRPDFDRAKLTQILPPMKMKISKISLMKSERIEGKLTYTEIHTVNI